MSRNTNSSFRDPKPRMLHLSCTSEDDILGDPNSYFEVDIALHEPARRASAGHRPSKSSSDSREFNFAASMSPLDFQEPNNISTADELFYKGKLLPLYVSQRLQMPGSSFKHPGSPEDSSQTSIAFSCYLHRADVDINMVMERESRELYPSDESLSYRNSGDKDSSSRDSSSEESSLSFNRNQHQHQQRCTVEQQVLGNEGSSGRFRWRLLLAGGQKTSSSKTVNCPESFCKSCGKQQQQQQHRKSEGELLRRPSHDPWLSHSGGYLHQTTEVQSRRTPYQGLGRAKELWRRYLKPLISRNSSSLRDSRSFMINSSAGVGDPMKNKRQRPRSTANTPLASPTHSGLLSVVAASPDDVQGAIAYCKQTRTIASSASPAERV